MRPQLQAVAGSQGGVFFRHQALDCGYTDDEIRRLKRCREWLVVRRGAYVEGTLAPPDSDRAGWHRLRTLATLHRLEVPAVASHSSAATLLGLPEWGRDLSRVHVTRHLHHAGRIEAGVAHHEAELPESHVITVAGVACTEGGRTAWDIGREFGFEAGVVAADAVLHLGSRDDPAASRRGGTRADLDALSTAMDDWPGSRTAKEAFAFADPGAESVGESLSRIFMVALGFPVPLTQVIIERTGFIARVDLFIEALRWVIEFDGRRKYRRKRDLCDPVIDSGDLVWAEKQREDALRSLGMDVSRLVWADLFGARRRTAAVGLWRKAERLGAPRDWPRPDWLRAA